MAAISSSKQKLLYLSKILHEESDEENEIGIAEIIRKLENYEIKAERKSISRDLEILRDFGYDISEFTPKKGYCLRERQFEISELRFLIDAVLSSKCITAKKSKELIEKLEKLTSVHTARKLKKNRTIDDRIKCKNEEFYYNIDKLFRAINENKKVEFQYYTYNTQKIRTLKREGYVYVLSPYDLVWNEDYYYLIGAHDKYDDLTHYRIDRMLNINIIDDQRKNPKEVKEYENGIDTSAYLKKTFKMFGGDTCTVDIKFNNNMINYVIDTFGLDIRTTPIDDNNFKMSAEVNVGEGFISWVLQLGKNAEVLYPESLRDAVRQRIENMMEMYN